MNLLDLDLVEKLAKHLEEDAAVLACEIKGEGKDKTRCYRGEIRARIYNRDKGFCFHCGALVEIQKMEVDHVIPYKLGGKTNEANGVCSCRRCNRSKGCKVW